jgi:Protein of unknown function (DUF1559)
MMVQTSADCVTCDPPKVTIRSRTRDQAQAGGAGWSLGRHTGVKHVQDGTGNTYLVGEKAMDTDRYETGTDVGDRAPIAGWTDHFGAANTYVRFAVSAGSRDIPNNCNACHNFGSAHPTTWNVSMADGSVRAISYDMDVLIHRMFASIDGGEVINKPE